MIRSSLIGSWSRPRSGSEREVDGAGGVPAGALVAFTHPTARQRHLGGANLDVGQMRADTELVGALVTEAADLRSEEHSRFEEIVAQATDRIVGVEGGRV